MATFNGRGGGEGEGSRDPHASISLPNNNNRKNGYNENKIYKDFLFSYLYWRKLIIFCWRYRCSLLRRLCNSISICVCVCVWRLDVFVQWPLCLCVFVLGTAIDHSFFSTDYYYYHHYYFHFYCMHFRWGGGVLMFFLWLKVSSGSFLNWLWSFDF